MSSRAHNHGYHDDHDHIHSDPGPMYELEWVQKLLGQIKQCLQANTVWFGLDTEKALRVLDYACGNGVVSSTLLAEFPNATFRGIDISTAQVKRYNEEAGKLGYSERMRAVQGDITDPQAPLNLNSDGDGAGEWFAFDAAVISMALHHVKDPIALLTLLRGRLKKGGVLIVIDWLKDGHKEEHAVYDAKDMVTPPGQFLEDKKYVVENMVKGEHGPKIWPGFSEKDVKSDLLAAGLGEVDVREWYEKLEVPGAREGFSRMFIARGRVL